MTATAEISNTKRYGTNGENVGKLIERLSNIDWYRELGSEDQEAEKDLEHFLNGLDINRYQIEWVSKENVPKTSAYLHLEASPLWEVLKELPDKLYEKIEETGRNKILDDLVYDIPELVYHGSFDGAYQLYKEEKDVSFLVGYGMYLGVLACAWELVADQDGWRDNPFLHVVNILERGHLPLGPQKDIIYIA